MSRQTGLSSAEPPVGQAAYGGAGGQLLKPDSFIDKKGLVFSCNELLSVRFFRFVR